MSTYEVVVVGAGINGLATAYHLLRRGVTSLAVVERYAVGHTLGSSHGKSRITRSSYSSAKYVELIQVAHQEEWPRFSREAGEPLLHPTRGCFFGPGVGAYLDAVRAVPSLQEQVRVLSVKEARRAFPQFLFPDSEEVIEDLTCAVVAAERTISFLAQKVAAGADLLEKCTVAEVERLPGELRLHTSRGSLSCGRLVVTAGAWLTRLFPSLRERFRCAHQDVGYYEVEGAGSFPVWVYSPDRGDSFYGLPEFGRPGVKVARHRTTRGDDPPDRQPPEAMPDRARAELRRFLLTQFAHPTRLLGYEACLYTNTVDEDFVLDHHPEDPRIVIGAACSGHGFKFGPLTGRIVADLVLDGISGVSLFEKHRASFSLGTVESWWRPER